jgi:hypothetical protein
MEPTRPLRLRPRFATPGYGSLLVVLAERDSPIFVGRKSGQSLFDLPEELRMRLRAKRAKAAATTAEVVHTATTDCLPKLVAGLRQLGFRGDGKTRPARFAMTASSLRALRRASKKTGLPACRLLLATRVQIYLHITAYLL